jgi:hypothetical protein
MSYRRVSEVNERLWFGQNIFRVTDYEVLKSRIDRM